MCPPYCPWPCIAANKKTSALEHIAEKISNVLQSGALFRATCCTRAFAYAMAHAIAHICAWPRHPLTRLLLAGRADEGPAMLRPIRSASTQQSQRRYAPAAVTAHPPPWQHRRTVWTPRRGVAGSQYWQVWQPYFCCHIWQLVMPVCAHWQAAAMV